MEEVMDFLQDRLCNYWMNGECKVQSVEQEKCAKCHVQGGSNMTGTDLYKRTHKSVPVIFEPPCRIATA